MTARERSEAATPLKGVFPFRLGAPSYVLPGDLAANVSRLAPLVDDVQLLFFESAMDRGLEHPLDLRLLRELASRHDLTYTVHLPTDLRLADPAARLRQQGIVEIRRLVEELAPLAPLAFDLHLAGSEGAADREWLDRLDASLSRLAAGLGPEWRPRVAVENLDYPLSQVRDLVRAHGFSFCLDFGHLIRYGHDWSEAVPLLSEARHVHYHGVEGGRDHRPLSPAQATETSRLVTELRQACYTGVLTLEIYHLESFFTSACLLAAGASTMEEYQE